MPNSTSWLRRPSVWGSLFVVLAAGGFFGARARGPRVPVVRVARHNLEQHLVASGRVMAPAKLEVAAVTTGLVTLVQATEGDRVKAGDLLVQLDDTEARAQLAQAQARVAEARARAEQVGSVAAVVASRALEQARATYDNSAQQFERTLTLLETGASSPEQRDAAKRALDVARAQLGSAEAEQRGASAEGVNARAANAALSQAVAQLALAKLRLSQTRVVAPQDAVVLSRDVEAGSVVSPGHSLMTLAAAGAARLLIAPDERDLALIQLGLSALASTDAFPDESFRAEVAYIAPSVDRERGTIDVRLRVPEAPAYLRADMSVSVDLTVAHKANAVVVQADAVRGLATPRPWTFVADKGRATRREIKLGIRGAGSVEVLTGLRPGELVVVPDGTLLVSGQRVRPFEQEP
jgi:HlyD family secretion protein